MSKTHKLSINEILIVSQALPELDGYQADGKATPFKFDGGTRWNIGKNLKVLAGEVELWEAERVAKIKELSPVNFNVVKESAEVQEAFRAWSDDFRKTIVEVNGLLALKRTKLFGADDCNPISGTVLAALMPIIEDDEPATP